MKPSPDGWGLVLGVTGAHEVWDNTVISPWDSGSRMPPNPDLQVGPKPDALHNVLYENLFGAPLDPESLYAGSLGKPGLSLTSRSGGAGSPTSPRPADRRVSRLE